MSFECLGVGGVLSGAHVENRKDERPERGQSEVASRWKQEPGVCTGKWLESDTVKVGL